MAALFIMPKKKQETKTAQTQNSQSQGSYANTNTYGEWKPSDTEDTKAFRDWKPQIDPGLSYQYGNARNKLRQSLISPTGGYRTAAMDDAILRGGERSLNQDEAQAYRGSQYDQNSMRAGQLGSLAALTQGRLVQTGASGTSAGTSSGTSAGNQATMQSGDLFGQLLGGASQVGSAALL